MVSVGNAVRVGGGVQVAVGEASCSPGVDEQALKRTREQNSNRVKVQFRTQEDLSRCTQPQLERRLYLNRKICDADGLSVVWRPCVFRLEWFSEKGTA